MDIEGLSSKSHELPKERLLSWRDAINLSIHDINELYREYISPGFLKLAKPFAVSREIPVQAEGCWIHTQSGRMILDMTGGVGVLRHGHNHPRLLQARREFQEQRRMEVHKQLLSPYMAVLARNLAAVLPGDLNVSFFCNSGAESVEAAVKMAYRYHRGHRTHILHSDIAFHGKLLGAGSLSQTPECPVQFPKISGTRTFQFNNIQSVKAQIAEGGVYAIVIEAMNVGNLLENDIMFLQELRELCTREDIVLICDEVYSGWFATGDLFAFSRSGIVPDVVCMSKSFGGGKSSISCTTARTPIFTRAYGNPLDALLHTTTYNGFGEETVTAIEALAVAIEENFEGKCRKLGLQLGEGLRALQAKMPEVIEAVRGRGVLQGLVLKADSTLLKGIARLVPGNNSEYFIRRLIGAAVVNEMFESHNILLFFQMGRSVPVIVSPPAVATEAEVNMALCALEKTLSQGLFALTAKLIKNNFT